VLAITDQLRPEAPAVATTDRLAIQVGITDVRGALLPDDKVAAVQRLRAGDAVVVRDDLTAIPAVIALSRRARRVVVANLVIAASFIGILVLWDLVGTLPPPLGVAGHEGSTLIVGLNGLRLVRRAAWHHAVRTD
jgi:cation-transporting P-type ATPase J